MPTATIVVTKNRKTGDLQVEVDGMVGTGCDALTEGFNNMMGVVKSDTKKNEYYEGGQTVNEAY